MLYCRLTPSDYYYSSHQARIADPVFTVTGTDRAGLVGALEHLTVDDLTFRMLAPHEIGAAMAFPGRYVVLGTNRDRVKQYGNAVTPPVMEMILSRCVESLR
jgi:DNA (cytosine-5)-methyltransferase 1